MDDVSKHLGVTKGSVYRLIDHQALPEHKAERFWRLKLSAVDWWVRLEVLRTRR